jgi:hypothetical protein
MIVSAAWIIPAVFAVINRLAQARLRGWGPVKFHELLFEFGDWLLYAFLTPGVFAISKRWPLTRPHLTRRIVLHLLFSLLFCVAWASCGSGAAILPGPNLRSEALPGSDAARRGAVLVSIWG